MNTEITKHADRDRRGWIFYDAACGSCVRGQRLTGRVFASRGFEWLPLQTPGAAARLGVSELAFEIRMHLLLADGRVFNNADAFGILCRSVWWLWPVGALLLVPGFREVGRWIYDRFAENRYGFGGACEIAGKQNGSVSRIPPKTIVLWPIWLHTIPLLALPLLALLFAGNVQPWIFMWALAFALFAGCKWLTHVTALRRGLKPRWSRALAYLLTWPGMDAESFYRIENRPLKPGTAEWSLAVANILLGLVLVWFVTRRVLPFSELATGWTGMVGIVLVLHFGWFKILSLAWRAVGVGAKPLMQTPVLAKSLGEFWGRRWNTAFHDLANRFGFRPLRRSIGATFATLAVFALSGLVHELVISVPARGGFGLPTVYFLIQGLGVVGEHTNTGRRMGLGRGGRGWLFAIMLAALPAPLLFHPPFIHNVILPMLAGIGAT